MSQSSEPTSSNEVEEWFELEEEVEEPSPTDRRDPAEKYAASQLRVVRETKDYQLDYLRVALQPGQGLIDISPKYQRRLRWNNKKKSLLIESFLLNIPVPPIYLFEHDYNAYEVIDGRQRLEALRSFLSNEMALTGLEYWPELNGKRFSTLPHVLQKGLVRRSLPAVVLLAETSKPTADEIDVRQVLFDRLNTGGVKLNPQELRNALYNGPLNSLLVQLARTEPFTQAWGIPGPTADEESDPPEELLRNPLYSTLADAELVLRFFALRDAVLNSRKGSLRRILDRYMSSNSHINEYESSESSHMFLSTLERLSTTFNGRPFVLPSGKRSRPLYDALMVALSINPEFGIESDAEGVRQRLMENLKDPDSYDILVGRGNTIQAVRDRVELASEILGGKR